MTKKSNPNILG